MKSFKKKLSIVNNEIHKEIIGLIKKVHSSQNNYKVSLMLCIYLQRTQLELTFDFIFTHLNHKILKNDVSKCILKEHEILDTSITYCVIGPGVNEDYLMQIYHSSGI